MREIYQVSLRSLVGPGYEFNLHVQNKQGSCVELLVPRQQLNIQASSPQLNLLLMGMRGSMQKKTVHCAYQISAKSNDLQVVLQCYLATKFKHSDGSCPGLYWVMPEAV